MEHFLLGEPFVCECPHCGNLIVTSVWNGSGAYTCPCSPGELLRFDYVSDDYLKRNQEKYADLIKAHLKGGGYVDKDGCSHMFLDHAEITIRNKDGEPIKKYKMENVEMTMHGNTIDGINVLYDDYKEV